ncbi:hypothetical protein EJF18_20420 [Clavispora lusitaniae]|uniref:Uncharacterized protein n=2 Tax=Clavispora lusitaniae TaxID=36911 RepID=C4Y0A3_CLAL4|nr:uncharacterized protein CLUG_01635 [Clavispora lusitaniae ATCC 42720]KAF5212125.1 hypothetical protein E0198_001681 [Clavispora lusitaniae]EEQ37512.1 hypothetical protein CLUG_01635 [Clavispora lusitaniae ATCC 42720]QFZ26515.1 hypothetical protein EJF14_20420 [Clavispora lusitaniae]QFZ32183.1 hypothetical protein EJF16_20420 [Clavispora lusitaniae]QFZ37852.1 hypothetical protein EJF15_20420 [Clavispora lusitaniae]
MFLCLISLVMAGGYTHHLATEKDVDSEIANCFHRRILNENSFAFRRAVDLSVGDLLPDLDQRLNQIRNKMLAKVFLEENGVTYNEYLSAVGLLDPFLPQMHDTQKDHGAPIISPYDFSDYGSNCVDGSAVWSSLLAEIDLLSADAIANAWGKEHAPLTLAPIHHQVFQRVLASIQIGDGDPRLAFDKIFSMDKATSSSHDTPRFGPKNT